MDILRTLERDVTGRFGIPYGIWRQRVDLDRVHVVVKVPLFTWKREGYHREYGEFEYGWWDWRLFIRFESTRIVWDLDWVLRRSLGPRRREWPAAVR
jgi:hypothetical protein